MAASVSGPGLTGKFVILAGKEILGDVSSSDVLSVRNAEVYFEVVFPERFTNVLLVIETVSSFHGGLYVGFSGRTGANAKYFDQAGSIEEPKFTEIISIGVAGVESSSIDVQRVLLVVSAVNIELVSMFAIVDHSLSYLVPVEWSKNILVSFPGLDQQFVSVQGEENIHEFDVGVHHFLEFVKVDHCNEDDVQRHASAGMCVRPIGLKIHSFGCNATENMNWILQ